MGTRQTFDNEHSTFNVEEPVIRRSRSQLRRQSLGVEWWMFIVECFLVLSVSAVEQPEKLVLQPPHDEIPLSFWERYGIICIVAALLLVVVVTVIWLVRHNRIPLSEPIADRTRRELQALVGQRETGETLSVISRTLRNYLTDAFGLSTGETTTTEFCRALAANGNAGPELVESLCAFLRRLDEMKFARDKAAVDGNAQRALELLDLAEARRALLRAAAERKPPIYS